MPGSVQNASSATVLPDALARRFSRSREWLIEENQYPGDGRSQRAALVATSRKMWSIDRRLDATELDALAAFFEARGGPKESFIFYDRAERVEEGATPLYDPTGVAAGPGKYEVRFVNESFEYSMGPARGDVSIAVIEVT